ncbi:MAG: hypothetical protein LBF25_03290 [Puniceicoccales bacterium]|jgi:hypothetical protein|nr:hypothetical protein [Puniceicoccales bacterium]
MSTTASNQVFKMTIPSSAMAFQLGSHAKFSSVQEQALQTLLFELESARKRIEHAAQSSSPKNLEAREAETLLTDLTSLQHKLTSDLEESYHSRSSEAIRKLYNCFVSIFTIFARMPACVGEEKSRRIIDIFTSSTCGRASAGEPSPIYPKKFAN